MHMRAALVMTLLLLLLFPHLAVPVIIFSSFAFHVLLPVILHPFHFPYQAVRFPFHPRLLCTLLYL